MVGAVDEKAADGGGQGLAADGAGLLEVGGGEGGDAAEGSVEAGVEFGEEDVFGSRIRVGGVEFEAERLELGGGQVGALGIGEQAVEAAGDVAQMEGNRGDATGSQAGVEGGGGQGGAGGVDVLAGKLEGVDDGAEDGGKASVCTAEPRFGHRDRVQGWAWQSADSGSLGGREPAGAGREPMPRRRATVHK